MHPPYPLPCRPRTPGPRPDPTGRPTARRITALVAATLLWTGAAAARPSDAPPDGPTARGPSTALPAPAPAPARTDAETEALVLPPLDDPEAEPQATGPTLPATRPAPSQDSDAPADADGWRAVRLPGKAATRYRRADHDGRAAWHAQADRSASLWRRPWVCPPQALGTVSFSWWVPALIGEARVDQRGRTDAPARLLFAFDGDSERLPLATRLKFELARALSGEEPPYATLAYVWDPVLPVDSVIVSPHSDRIRKIVVESGAAGLGRWRDHRRDLAADFRRAFGEAPGALRSVALMTDADNTGTQAQAWYGEVHLQTQDPATPDRRD
ncbi:MAG: hypothetical protein RL223_741 [Pseudomonadota bacterium]|jgi:hypothetical protein